MKVLSLCSSVLLILQTLNAEIHNGGILFPRESETRQISSLDGLWNFVVPHSRNPLEGFENHWYKRELKDILGKDVDLMPVPASYNDITTDWRIRDHVGLVWYDRTFIVPKYWSELGRVWIRFESVSYASQVWINGNLVMSHEIGHLPFHSEITKYLKFGKENRVTVACDNTLLSDTLPQGTVEELTSKRLAQSYTFDFFNYAGIDRPVKLYTTPMNYIDDITVFTSINQDLNQARITYNISLITDETFNSSSNLLRVTLIDQDKNAVAKSAGKSSEGFLTVEDPILWWPYLMDENPGYLYNLQVELLDSEGNLVDKYTQPVGIRELRWTNTSFLINNKPVYLHGFGRHEDSNIRGKGLDLPLIIRDHNLIKWIGANTYRTSHYPYAEEIMDMADRLGIMIVNECPGVDVDIFSPSLLAKHKISLTEMIKRDKNRPSTIMWSAANEPRTQHKEATEYFKEVIEHIKSLDTTRPTTIVEAQSVHVVQSSSYVDIISFNRYNGWYSEAGNLDVIKNAVITEATAWHKKFNKPVLMSEYGADTMEGLHFEPAFIWSEEYQMQLMSEHFKAFDSLREQGFFIGEYIWNFADFKTAQTYTRVGGNKKGIFTRNREPKSSAYFMRKRYWSLAKQYNSNITMPSDLNQYITNKKSLKDEL